jgi:hypothetical protein
MEIRKLSLTLPVVLCSGFSKENDISEVNKDSNTFFIRKPYQANFLANAEADAQLAV